MADFEKELSKLRVGISQNRVKTEEMITEQTVLSFSSAV